MMTITVVCLFLVYQFSGSAGLLYQNRDHNESVKSDHDLLTQFEQKLRNLTDEVNSLKALEIEMGHLKKENRWLMNEVQICNQTLGNTSKTVDNLMKQTRYLSVSMLDLTTTTKSMNRSISECVQDISSSVQNTSSMCTRVSRELKSYQENQNLRDIANADVFNKTVADLMNDVQKYSSEQLKVSASLTSMQNTQAHLVNQISAYGTRVAFTAGFVQHHTGDESSTDMIFPHVITNIGGGYNSRNGVFTAPTSGTYVFFTTIVSWDDGAISTDIVLNGNSQVRTHASSTGFQQPTFYVYETGTNLVCLHLQVGDRVWVRRYSGKGFIVTTAPTHTFSGYLL
ncbi:uncharacterized protein LOC125683636 [Ostrea edulis]|uniref:uncharacterized protein LOC125683636 n=1 Tax=Ostrea edulis TaxID=37623 RepID=UPI0024AEBEE9|nr:uncharacterized protein LOC125683636 [Ostrea edulis]